MVTEFSDDYCGLSLLWFGLRSAVRSMQCVFPQVDRKLANVLEWSKAIVDVVSA